MGKKTQVISLCVLLIGSLALYYFGLGNLRILENKAFFFTHGLILLFLGFFIIERHFTKQRDIVVNCLAVVMSLMAIGIGQYRFLWIALAVYTALILCLTLISILLLSPEKTERTISSVPLRIINKLVKTLGNARVLFSLTFFYGLIEFNGFPLMETKYFWFILVWGFVLVWEPLGIGGKIENVLSLFASPKSQEQIGIIVRSKSPDIIYCQLEENVNLKSNDLVEVQLKVESSKNLYGIVLNIFFLQDKNWANIRILSDMESRNVGSLFSKAGPISKACIEELSEDIKTQIEESEIYKNRENIIGIVDTNSAVNQIRVQLTNRNIDLNVGSVVYCISNNGDQIYYQVSLGITQEDHLAEANKFGFVAAFANQLGIWDRDKKTFDRYDWVPELNSAIFLHVKDSKKESRDALDEDSKKEEYAQLVEDSEKEKCPELHKDQQLIGQIPNSDFPVYAAIEDLVTCHYSVLGITGCGKTTFEIDLIQKKIEMGYKVLCFDITGDYAAIFSKMEKSYIPFYDVNTIQTLQKKISELDSELNKRKWDQTQSVIDRLESELKDIINTSVGNMFKNEDSLYIVEIEELANTTTIHDLFQRTLKGIFDYKRTKHDVQLLSIVFEEAHTIIPERSSSTFDYGASDRIVNKIAQITLQGRKYGIGFSIITQRTANVSKTILNQCNTTFSFACYDRTAKEFLANYYGEEYSNILPNLGKYQVLAAGKAINSVLPVIVQLPVKDEPIDINEARKLRRDKMKTTEDQGEAIAQSSAEESQDDDLPF